MHPNLSSLGWFFHHDVMFARKWPFPLGVLCGYPPPHLWSMVLWRHTLLIDYFLHDNNGLILNTTFGSSLPRQNYWLDNTPWTKELKDTNPLMSSLLVICLGRCSNFVGSESGQKLLQNMVYSTVQHPPPLQSHTQSVPYILYTAVHLVWGGEVREKV